MNRTATAFLTLLFSFTLISVTQAAGKPAMPHELEEIVSEDFMHLEEAYRDGEWKEAHEITLKMETAFEKLLPDILRQSMPEKSKKILNQFDFQLKTFKKVLATRNHKKAEHTFSMIEAVLVDVIESFSYDKHPVLAMFDHEIGEFIEDMNYKEISGEIHEMEGFLSRIESSFIAKGVSKIQIEEYHQSLKQLQSEVDARHKARTLSRLKELRKINSGMMAMVRSR